MPVAARVWPVDAVAGSPSNTGRSLRQGAVSPSVAQASGSRPLGGLSGVRPGTPITIASATSTTWTVTPFLGLIDGEAAAIAGVYAYSFDTNQTGSVTAAAGSARIDRLDVQISDPAESDGSSTPGIAIVYTAGTPGSGVAAAAPSRTHPLALINVPASGGGSPTVSWTATYYSAPGGFVPFNTLTGLQAWTTASYAQHASVINDGTAINNTDYVYNGTSWVRMVPLVTSGLGSLTTDASGLGTITHNLGTTPSHITLTPVYTTNTVSSVFRPTVGAVTSTTFQLVAFRTDSSARLASTAVQFYWEAWL